MNQPSADPADLDTNPCETKSKQCSQRLALWVKRSLFWLLLGSYALGAFLPEYGNALRTWDFGDWAPGGVPARFSLWMVAVLLFCGAASTDLSKLFDFVRKPRELLIGLASVWIFPLLIVTLWGVLLSAIPLGLEATSKTSILLGIALTAAMPVANSAVGWTQQSHGNLVWAIGFVVLSITLCPWVAPLALKAMGLTLGPTDAAQANSLVNQFTGSVFIVWVIVPTLLGFAIRRLVGGHSVHNRSHWLVLVSALALLLLNYANASMALPKVVNGLSGTLLLTTLVVATSLPLVGHLIGWGLARILKLPSASRTAWGYSLGMKNTGLALSLADTALSDQPIVVLVILASTLMQHAVASLAHMPMSWHAKRQESAQNKAEN